MYAKEIYPSELKLNKECIWCKKNNKKNSFKIIGKIYFQITAEYMLYGIMKNLYMLEKHLG